jgi:hypothetical protein
MVSSLVHPTVLGTQRQCLTTIPLLVLCVHCGVSSKPPVVGGSLDLTWLPLLLNIIATLVLKVL